MKNMLTHIRNGSLELLFWCVALISLWHLDPHGSHVSLCPLQLMSWDWCPGCGLGRSIGLLMKGEFAASWALHPLGGFALAVISYRIFEIIKYLKITQNYG